MYKHSALSIKETDDKFFVSLEEKQEINNVPAIKNFVSELDKKYDDTDTHLNTLDEYVHNNNKVIYEECEGSYMTVDNSMEGNITDIEILGNTVQDSIDLSDIKSVGKLREDGLYEIELTSCGKNLFDGYLEEGYINSSGGLSNANNNRYTTDFIQIPKSNTNFIFSRYDTTTETMGKGIDFAFYDIDKKFIRNDYSSTAKTRILNVGDNEYFVKITVRNVSDISSLICQLENGNISTSYEEYVESTSKILLPCKLEKVGNTSDRLFRREDDKWYIEKNTFTFDVKNITFNNNQGDSEPCIFGDALVDIPNLKFGKIICDKLPFQISNDLTFPHTFAWNSGNGVRIQIVVPRGTEISSYKDTLTFKGIAITPQVIELPLNTQIQLNSFFGTTNVYMESGDVEGTIKCKICKSLGGSINSLVKETNNLTNRLESVETLQEGNDISISTDKGHVFCEDTRDGYIKDINIEGNTLVNKLGNVSYTFQSYQTGLIELDLEEGELYTIVAHNIKGTSQYCVQEGTSYIISYTNAHVTTFVARAANRFRYRPGTSTDSITYPYIFNVNFSIIKGDYTNNPPSYFEGIKSVGYNEEPLKITSLNGNIFSHVNIPAKIGGVDADTVVSDFITYDDGFTASSTVQYYGIHYPFVCLKDGYVYIKYNPTNAVASIWSTSESTDIPTTTISSNYVKFKCVKGQIYKIGFRCSATGQFSARDIDIRYNEILTESKLSIKDSKQLLYKNNEGNYVPIPVLRGLQDGAKDTIEKHSNGKYYYHKRCEEILLNGSENWFMYMEYDDKIDFRLKNNNSKIYGNVFNNIISDCVLPQFNNDSWNAGKNGIGLFGTDPHFLTVIDKNKLSSQNLAGFKSWLQTNPVTVVYELANEEVYECNDIELNSYDDETLVMIDNITLSPDMTECKDVVTPSKIEFGITSHIGNTLVKMKEEVDKNTKFRESLTESVTLSKEFNKGYGIIDDTKDGVLSIDKLEGGTLVNLSTWAFPNSDWSGGTGTWIHTSYKKNIRIEVGKTYSFCAFGDFKNFSSVRLGHANSLSPTQIKVTELGKFFKFTGQEITEYGICVIFNKSVEEGFTEAEKKTLKFIIVEGDHTDKDPVFFEGLKSVGDLEDLKVESTNANLFNESYIEPRLKDDGYYYFSTTGNTSSTFFFGVYKASDGQMVGSHYPNNSTDLTGYDINDLRVVFGINGNLKDDKTTFPLKDIISTKSIGKLYKSLEVIQVDVNNYKVKNPMLIFGDKSKPYIKREHDSKEILYKNSNGVYEKPILRCLPNGVKDTIEKHSDGKYYYHKRCEEILFNGSEDWDSNGTDNADYMHFYKIPTKLKAGTCTVSDVLSSIDYVDFNKDCIFNSPNYHNIIFVSIQRSKLTAGQTFAGFKAWLQANPLTVVYQLVNEEVYECNNLDLDSFDGDTNIILNSTIPVTTTAKIQNNLANTMESLRDRTTSLEDRLMDLFKMVASGNVQNLAYELYPQDFEPVYENNDSIIDTLEEL